MQRGAYNAKDLGAGKHDGEIGKQNLSELDTVRPTLWTNEEKKRRSRSEGREKKRKEGKYRLLALGVADVHYHEPKGM